MEELLCDDRPGEKYKADISEASESTRGFGNAKEHFTTTMIFTYI